MNRRPFTLPALLGWLLLAGTGLIAPVHAQSSSPSIFDEEPAGATHSQIPDHLPKFNRAIFHFNDQLYTHVLRPISRGYAKVVPSRLRRGIGNFFHNIAFPTRFAGNVLEGKFKSAGIETARFLVNTVSTLGFYPTANDDPRLPEQPSDLGQAFGSWGIGHGSYLVLPLLGPSSFRDGVGQGLSGYFLDPVHYLNDSGYRYGVGGLAIVNQSPDLLREYDNLKAAAIDPYIALRDAYSAQRARRPVKESQVQVIPAAAAAAPAP